LITAPDELFFHALQQDPDDDLTRLAYADALEERGDEASTARAELVRVQVELAALPLVTRAAHQRAAELTQRQNELLNDFERDWVGEWADVLGGWAFRRGLVEAVRADASAFLEHAADWFARWPTLSVIQLRNATLRVRELAESPWLAHLRGLELRGNGIDARSLRHLTESRYLCELQALDLSHNPIGPAGAALLAAAPHADALSELHLDGCDLGSGRVAALLGGRRWRRLDLSHNDLTRDDLAALAVSPTMRDLTALDLAMNPTAVDGVAELVSSPSAAGVVDLGLGCMGWASNRFVAALAGSPHLRGLRSLDLRQTGWSNQGHVVAVLSDSPLLGQLWRLLLGQSSHSNGWTDDVLGIARPPRRLVVKRGHQMAKALLRSKHLTPTQLIECDLEELWMLGDVRDRRPASWDGGW
jgi:uncharacterized protein (TIGR02996 family)